MRHRAEFPRRTHSLGDSRNLFWTTQSEQFQKPLKWIVPGAQENLVPLQRATKCDNRIPGLAHRSLSLAGIVPTQ